MKKLIVLILVVGAAGFGIWYFARDRGKTSEPSAAPKTAKVVRGDLELFVDATGSVESNLDVDIKSKASGKIVALPYDVSQIVPAYKDGVNEDKALVSVLDPTDEQRAVQQIQAARDAAQAQFKQAECQLDVARENVRIATLEAAASINSAQAKAELDKLTFKRQEDLFKRKASTENERDLAAADAKVSQAALELAMARQEAIKAIEIQVKERQAQVDLARANLAGAEVRLADAKQRLAETKVYSPIDGVITRRDVQIGQIIASGIINVAGGTTLMTISDMSRMFVTASVDESDIGRLIETGRLDQQVVITADAYPGKKFTGKVVQITPRGQVEGNVVTYPVKVEVLGEGRELLRPKMTASVKILAGSRTGTLLIPNAAIIYDRDKTVVDLSKGGESRTVPVKIGLSDGLQAEVLEGLAEGDEVLLGASQTRWTRNRSSTTTQAASQQQRTTDR
ncbi:MAG: efflux RND transporter periplasmic adaptor subunit [Planctomycetes bacterium]|nr:efflux RND transporter periplasmic adaptor subunit [Planctomycetota bacterium]